jgi:hypothetical protein
MSHERAILMTLYGWGLHGGFLTRLNSSPPMWEIFHIGTVLLVCHTRHRTPDE